MKLSEIINEIIYIKFDQAIEQYHDSYHGQDGIRMGDSRPEKLEELYRQLDKQCNQ